MGYNARTGALIGGALGIATGYMLSLDDVTTSLATFFEATLGILATIYGARYAITNEAIQQRAEHIRDDTKKTLRQRQSNNLNILEQTIEQETLANIQEPRLHWAEREESEGEEWKQ